MNCEFVSFDHVQFFPGIPNLEESQVIVFVPIYRTVRYGDIKKELSFQAELQLPETFEGYQQPIDECFANSDLRKTFEPSLGLTPCDECDPFVAVFLFTNS